jgi:hypothetical protein
MCAACEYDSCFADSQCPGEDVCVCGGQASVGRPPNYCSQGGCRVDSDCGPGGYCSRSYYPCSGGLAGYYCHTPGDECTSDAQCSSGLGSVCEWSATSMAWTCVQQTCPG